jgi:hypothetical protein
MYWLFVINFNYWNEFLETNQKNICCEKEYGIKKNDKVIIYTKGKKSGFIGICECLFDEELNTNNKNIFSSKKDNKFIIGINKIEYFNKLINLKLLFKKIKQDIFKSVGSFKYKYIRGNIIYNKLTYIQGDCIINIFNDINKETIIDTVKNKSIDNNIFVKITEKEDKSEVKNNNVLLHIPILVIPKVNISLPETNNNDKLKVFNDIYNKYNVEIINNDDYEISGILNTSNIEFKEINSLTSNEDINKYYITALESYHKCETYNPCEYKEIPFIRIICIEDIKDDYYGCYLITWVTKKYIYEEVTDSTSSTT